MRKEQILELIKAEEQRLHEECVELQEFLGNEHRATRYASAQWNAVSTILKKIENENA